MSRDDDVRELFEESRVEPTEDERAAILAAAEPILAGHAAAAAGRRATWPSWTQRFRALFAPRRLAFAAGIALIAGIVLLQRGAPPVRETRSAPLRSWAEHVSTNPGRPFPLASESFGRPY